MFAVFICFFESRLIEPFQNTIEIFKNSRVVSLLPRIMMRRFMPILEYRENKRYISSNATGVDGDQSNNSAIAVGAAYTYRIADVEVPNVISPPDIVDFEATAALTPVNGCRHLPGKCHWRYRSKALHILTCQFLSPVTILL